MTNLDPGSLGEVASPESAETPQQEDHSLLPGFLKNIPDQDRAIVSKYTKDWDAGVTKRFQSIHDEYKGKLQPYEALGYDPDTLGRMVSFIDMINNDPGAAYTALQEVIQNNNPELWEALQQGNGVETEVSDTGEVEDFGGLDPAIQQLIEQQNAQIQELNEWRQSREQSEIEQEQFDAFDQMIDGLLQQAGIADDDEFARDYIITQIAREKTPQDAVKQYQSYVNGLRNSQNTRPAPRIIGGQGGVPSDQVDASKMRGEQRREYIASLLANNQQG